MRFSAASTAVAKSGKRWTELRRRALPNPLSMTDLGSSDCVSPVKKRTIFLKKRPIARSQDLSVFAKEAKRVLVPVLSLA